MVENAIASFLADGSLLNIFLKHSSAAICINENSDPSVRTDMMNHLNRLAPENESYYTHTYEGSDDMPAHIKSSLVGVSVTIPIIDGRLGLGVWQGVYLGEFRDHGGERKAILTVI